MARPKVEIAPWKWVEKVKPEEVTHEEVLQAYRLKGPGIARCPYRCLRNCRKNPFCIWGMGEKAWILSGMEDNSDEDNNPEFRKEDDFAGIINFGTTCYVNALLQLWFHNPIIRPAILSWKPPYAKEGEEYQPLCPLGQLQSMFARMKLSKRRAIDPTTLIESLWLNIAEQQDAQEFAKLFMSMLAQLATEDGLQGELNRAFEGISKYEMECKECHSKHSREETFTELDLCGKDVKGISASFTILFSEEELTGDNQYLCQSCSKKTDAIRRFSIVKLPPVLHIQLFRVINDKDIRLKKKATATFPEFLDMSSYVQPSEDSAEDLKYQLTGYLVHNGKSASSGHYIAHVRDIRSGAWHICNDDSVSEQKAAKSSKNVNEEETTMKSEKTGEYKSTGAYMLVYTHQSLIKNPTPDPEVPSYLKQLVASEDATFESEIQTSKKQRELKAQYLEERKATVEALYSLLIPDKYHHVTPMEFSEVAPAPQTHGKPETKVNGQSIKRCRPNSKDGPSKKVKVKTTKATEMLEEQLAYEKPQEYKDRLGIASMEFLPSSWLRSWLSQSTETVPMIETKEIKCPHNKLSLPAGVTSAPYKAIPTEIADILYEKYGGENRLTGKGALCKDCVVTECKHQRSLMDLESDYKRVQELMIKTIESTKSIETYLKNREGVDYSEDFWTDKFWVSKNSMRKWKGWARARLFPAETPPPEVEMITESSSSSQEPSASQDFNDDIKCDHNNLSVDEGTRRLVDPEVWSIIRKYFPECFQAPASSTLPCFECQGVKQQNKDRAAENRKLAEKLKENVSDLLRNRNRPRVSQSGHYYFVDADFVRSIVGFSRQPEKADEGYVGADTGCLLCDHEKFKYPVDLVEKLTKEYREFVGSADHERIEAWCLLREEEWIFLDDIFMFEHEITVYSENGNCLYFPEVCEECSQEWYKETYSMLCQFTNEPLFLKPMDSDEMEVAEMNNGEEYHDDDLKMMQLPSINWTITAEISMKGIPASEPEEGQVQYQEPIIDFRKMIEGPQKEIVMDHVKKLRGMDESRVMNEYFRHAYCDNGRYYFPDSVINSGLRLKDFTIPLIIDVKEIHQDIRSGSTRSTSTPVKSSRDCKGVKLGLKKPEDSSTESPANLVAGTVKAKEPKIKRAGVQARTSPTAKKAPSVLETKLNIKPDTLVAKMSTPGMENRSAASASDPETFVPKYRLVKVSTTQQTPRSTPIAIRPNLPLPSSAPTKVSSAKPGETTSSLPTSSSSSILHEKLTSRLPFGPPASGKACTGIELLGCIECGKTYSMAADTLFRTHMIIKHDKELTDEQVLKSIMRVNQFFRCQKCSVVLLNNLESHQKSCCPNVNFQNAFSPASPPGGMPLKCGLCSWAVDARVYLVCHLKVEHPEVLPKAILHPHFRCAICLRVFLESSELITHAGTCSATKSSAETMLELAKKNMECAICGISHNEIRETLRCYQMRSLLRCILCLNVFKIRKNFFAHLQTCHGYGSSGLKCPFCDAGWMRPRDMFDHIIDSHYSEALRIEKEAAIKAGRLTLKAKAHKGVMKRASASSVHVPAMIPNLQPQKNGSLPTTRLSHRRPFLRTINFIPKAPTPSSSATVRSTVVANKLQSPNIQVPVSSILQFSNPVPSNGATYSGPSRSILGQPCVVQFLPEGLSVTPFKCTFAQPAQHPPKTYTVAAASTAKAADKSVSGKII